MKKQQFYDYTVTCVIMGGGAGTRLHPLTNDRAKPAVPVGAKFRLIDIPISNCLNSGINRIYVLTQFNSTSLHRHVTSSYHFHRFSRGFVEILAAQQSPRYTEAHSWYEGTADAVRKNLPRLREAGQDDVLILSGDQLYRMDFEEVLRAHRGGAGAACDLTIAALLVPRERARNLGIMRIDTSGRVLEFVEKPGDDDSKMRGLEAPESLLAAHGIKPGEGPYFLANMGIYCFRHPFLEEVLRQDSRDFGAEVLPAALAAGEVRAFLFDDYWDDIGTIRTFHEANIALAGPEPQFDFYSESRPVYTRARLLPASSLQSVTIREALISDGCIVQDAEIEKSLLGVRSRIGPGCKIRNTFVMGNEQYESSEDAAAHRAVGHPDLGIGGGSVVENAIIDKDARVGCNVRLVNRDGRQEHDGAQAVIRDGIIVVPRGAIIPDGYEL